MQPNWDDLRVFLAVARAESLSRAGRLLRLDPATAGRRVARLERACGAPLFVKSPTGYALTDAGQRLMTHAIRAEQALKDATDDLAGQAAGITGQIRIGAPDGAANFLLPRVCDRIGRDNPGLELQIVALPRIFNLTRREADMVVAVSPPTAGRLTVQKIADYHLHLAACESYLAGAPAIHRLEDLRAHRIVGYIPDMIFDPELDYLGEAGLDHADLASNSVTVQMNLIREGAGLGIIHDFSLPFFPTLRKLLPEALCLTRSFYLVRHADDRRLERHNRFASRFCNALRAELTRLEARS